MKNKKPRTVDKNVVRAYGKVETLEAFRIKPLARLVYSDKFELFIAFVIGSNAVALAFLTVPGIDEAAAASAELIDAFCYGIYTIELVIRILSYGKRPWLFFKKGWNLFDFLIIAGSPLFAGQTVILRIMRLFRLVRIFRVLPEVRILSSSIVKSLPPLMSMGALIGLLVFLYGMVGFYLFGSQLEHAWGSIGASMISLVFLLTTENFPMYVEEGMSVTPLAIPYFLSYLFIIVFTVLNLLIGIVLNAMDEARAEDKKQATEESEFRSITRKIEEILEDGEISNEELTFLQNEINRIKAQRKG